MDRHHEYSTVAREDDEVDVEASISLFRKIDAPWGRGSF